MAKQKSKSNLMTETTFYILLTLVEPLHGYAVMKKVEKISEGTVLLGPGTMYGAFSKMIKEQLIEVFSEDDRRKFYQLTGKGKNVLADQIQKLSIMVKNGEKILDKIQ